MSINLETGLWRCFKSGNKGNFVYLYSIVEKVPYRKAYENFLFENFLHEDTSIEPEKEIKNFEDTTKFKLIDVSDVTDDPIHSMACDMILSRRMQDFNFYLCTEGFYKDRIILPFFDSNGKLFFFQARGLKEDSWPKYLNCKNLKSSQVLYPFDYESTEPLFITEGTFDCLALKACGLNATTTLSCHTSKTQMDQLKFYNGPLVCAFDSDDAGRKGTRQFMSMAYKFKLKNLKIVSPDKKDWSEVFSTYGKNATLEMALKCQDLDDYYFMTSGL